MEFFNNSDQSFRGVNAFVTRQY